MHESRTLTVADGSYLTGQQVRSILGIGKSKFLELVKTGELEDVIKVGAHFRVSEKSVKDYIERNRVRPGQRAAAS